MDIDDFSLARTLHILAIVMWIGGVAFVTTTAMPAIRANYPPGERLRAFHHFEHRFVWQARFWVLLAGGTGFWMVQEADLWSRYRALEFWWMHAMFIVWLIFFSLLFVIEPLVLQHRTRDPAAAERDYTRMERMHRILLTLALVAVVGAAAGSRGLF